MTAKLNAYVFNTKAVRFVYDYLTSRKQRTKKSVDIFHVERSYPQRSPTLRDPNVQYLDRYYSTLTYAISFSL